MSGILDNKSRIIDAIITAEGRRQIADGNFVVKFVTFSDSQIYYQKGENGHEDPTNKIYLECFNSPNDQIIFESDDSGKLVPFKNQEFISSIATSGSITSSLAWTSFSNGKLSQNIKNYGINFASITGSYQSTPIKNNSFASQIEGILTSSFDNFRNLKIIGSKDSFFEDQEFALNNNEITFKISSNEETLQMQNPTSINSIDALFNDEKLRNVDNFRYLPPIKKTSNNIDKTDIQLLENSGLILGNYPPWGPIDRLSYQDITEELSKYENTSKTVYFDPTSRDNELVAQMFEVSPESISKLDVIDYGRLNNNSNNPLEITHHVFFVGKTLIDDMGSTNFVHLFTLLFETNEEDDV